MASKKSAFRFNKEDQAQFLNHIRAGMRRGAAADAVLGEGESNRRKVREYIDTHRTFELEVLDAEVDATELVEEALFQAAISGSVAAAKTWIDLKGEPSSAESVGRPHVPAASAGDPFGDLDELATRRRRRS